MTMQVAEIAERHPVVGNQCAVHGDAVYRDNGGGYRRVLLDVYKSKVRRGGKWHLEENGLELVEDEVMGSGHESVRGPDVGAY